MNDRSRWIALVVLCTGMLLDLLRQPALLRPQRAAAAEPQRAPELVSAIQAD
jgi:hypothetical protein